MLGPRSVIRGPASFRVTSCTQGNVESSRCGPVALCHIDRRMRRQLLAEPCKALQGYQRTLWKCRWSGWTRNPAFHEALPRAPPAELAIHPVSRQSLGTRSGLLPGFQWSPSRYSQREHQEALD